MHTFLNPFKYRTKSPKTLTVWTGAAVLFLPPVGPVEAFGLERLGGQHLSADRRGLGELLPSQPVKREEAAKPGASSGVSSGWSIVIGSIVIDESPDEARRLAEGALERVRTKGALPEAQMEERGKSQVIYYGRYEGPKDSKAVADLDRIRGVKIDGAMPYQWAYLAPPPGEALHGTIAQYDLRDAKSMFGRSKLYYTLQVGMYGNADGSAPKADDLKEAREAAEKAAVNLRREGEMAFYYHGPTRSTVTVGLFSADELNVVDPVTKASKLVDTPTLAGLRKLHQYNLLNGQGIKKKIPNAEGGGRPVYMLEPSFLVEVPK